MGISSLCETQSIAARLSSGNGRIEMTGSFD